MTNNTAFAQLHPRRVYRRGITGVKAVGRAFGKAGALPLLAAGAALLAGAPAQAQQYITNVICNPVNGGAIVRTTLFEPVIPADTGLAMSLFYGAGLTFDAGTDTTTCAIPVANVGNNPQAGSLNQSIASASALARSIVTIDYTIGASGPNDTFLGLVTNARRFLYLADGLMPDGATAQNRLPPVGPGPALVVSNTDLVVRGNGETRGDTNLVGTGSTVEVNFDAADPTTYADYFVAMNGNISAQTASSGSEFRMMHATLTGNFTGSNQNDIGIIGLGGTIGGSIDALDGDNTLTIQDDAQVTGGIGAGDGANNLLIRDEAVVAGGLGAGLGDNTTTIQDMATVSGAIQFLGGADSLFIAGNADITGVTVFDADGVSGGAAGVRDALTFDGWSGTVDSGLLQNWEQVLVTGNGDVTFTGAGLDDGNTDEELLLQTDDGSFARFAASFTVAGNVNNFGTLDLSTANGTPDTTLTVSGDYDAGSDLLIDVDAAADSADVLIITGDVTGVTTITVNDTSTGAATGNDILVVDVSPTSTQVMGAFVLAASPVTIGGLPYVLEQDGAGDWYLVLDSTTPPANAEPIPALPLGGIVGLAGLLYLMARRRLGTRVRRP